MLAGGTYTAKPGAPTIGTATVTGTTTATVAFTAPASNGGAAITSYTATSSPGSITGTLSQAGSGTITVSGLTTGTAYTFTVTATNAVGTSAASAASNSITTYSAPANTVAPAVTGTATRGQTLSSTTGTWTGVPTPTFTYQWQRVTTNIASATSSTYVLVTADVGNTIRCVVTATNTVSAISANSNATASVAAVVAGAPTIGTATQTGTTTATVAFTAPADNGGATITSYTATSSPGSITGTLSQAGSGTITVSGLTASTAYTFTVTATNSAGTSAASAASNSITTAGVSFYARLTEGSFVRYPGAATDSSGNYYTTGTDGVRGVSVAVKYSSAGAISSAIRYNNSGVRHISTVSSSGVLYTTYTAATYNAIVSLNTSLGIGSIHTTYAPSVSGHEANGPVGGSLCIDSSNNIYMRWNINDTNTASQVYAVSKHNSSGVTQYYRYIEGTSLVLTGMVSDGSVSYVMGRQISGTLNYIAKLDSTMAISSQKTFNSETGSGGTFFAGTYDSTNAFVYAVGIGAGSGQRALVVQYNTSLAVQWAKGLVSASTNWVSCCLDSSNNLYAIGYDSAADVTIIAKYNSSGTLQWQRSLTSFTTGTQAGPLMISVTGSNMVINGRTSGQPDPDWQTIVLPTDGSKTGGLVNTGSNYVTYAATAYTDTAYTSYITATPTHTLTNGTLPTESDLSITTTAITPTSTITTL